MFCSSLALFIPLFLCCLVTDRCSWSCLVLFNRAIVGSLSGFFCCFFQLFCFSISPSSFPRLGICIPVEVFSLRSDTGFLASSSPVRSLIPQAATPLSALCQVFFARTFLFAHCFCWTIFLNTPAGFLFFQGNSLFVWTY